MFSETTLNELQNEPVRVHCPIRGVIELAPPDVEEIAPLVAHLQANQTTTESITFPRGTVLEDGRLDLCKQHLGALGCRMVTDALADNTTISSLLLGTDGIGDTGAADVARLIERNAHLEIVYLGCNFIGETGAAKLAASLRANSTLKALLLNVNHLEDEGTCLLADGLRQNTTLEELGLGSCHIGPEGIAALLPALRARPALLALDLGYSASTQVLGAQANHIGDEGAVLLAEWLRDNPPLRRLNLRGNGISTPGRAALHAALETNTNLLHLALDTKHDIHTDAFNALLERNRSQTSNVDTPPSRDITLIRSVYRTGNTMK